MRFGLIAGALFLFSMAGQAQAIEHMTDRCSGDVSFPLHYDGGPTDPGSRVFQRGRTSGWSDGFQVGLGPGGRIRWWCRSTRGNWIDFATYTFGTNSSEAKACITAIGTAIVTENPAALAGCSSYVKIGSSARNGWTPERSRCNSRSSWIRVLMKGGREFEIKCARH